MNSLRFASLCFALFSSALFRFAFVVRSCREGARVLLRPCNIRRVTCTESLLRSIRSGNRFRFAPLFEALRQSFARLLQKPGLLEVVMHLLIDIRTSSSGVPSRFSVDLNDLGSISVSYTGSPEMFVDYAVPLLRGLVGK